MLRTVDDEFLNPAGTTVRTATKKLLDAVLGEDIETESLQKSMKELIRLQAVQELSPAQAMLPFVTLKQHIYNIVEKALVSENFLEYKEMTDRIDTLMLMAFDMFAQDKEELYRVRVKELKNAQSQILRFAQSKGFPTDTTA